MAAIGFGVVGILESHPVSFHLAANASVVTAVAIWQLATRRIHTEVLFVLTIGGLATVLPFAEHEVAHGLSFLAVLLALLGIFFLTAIRLRWYIGFTALFMSSHAIAGHLIASEWSANVIVIYLTLMATFAVGATIVVSLRSELGKGESRYRYLFKRAPVALWEHDFSRVYRWLADMRSRGVEDIRSYLTAHPDDFRHGISLIRTTDANQAAASLHGVDTVDALLGKFLSGLVDAETERVLMEQFVTMWEGGIGDDYEFRGLRSGGTLFDGILHWSNPLATAGDLSRTITAVTDVTLLRQAQDDLKTSDAHSRALIDAVPDLMFIFGADGDFLDYHAANGMAGDQDALGIDDLYVPPSGFLGRRVQDVMPPEVADTMSMAITMALETGDLQVIEYTLPISSRDRHWEMRLAQLENSPKVMALVRDITERVEARKTLETLVQSKDDFIAAISHEIRTPLTGVLGYAHLLHEDAGTLPPEERRAMIEAITRESSDLSNIVEDLLVAAKTELGRLQVARVPTDLRAQAAQVLESWDQQSDVHVALVGPSVKCTGDPTRVRQVIRNLVVNAQRYGGDRVEIRVVPGSSMGRLLVADNGPGIPSDRIEEAFSAYSSLRTRKGLTTSLGIGLPISLTLARAMLGDLTYEYVAGEARFELSLPLADSIEPLDGVVSGNNVIGILGRAAER
jgi:signal transduction histidine kinase